MMDGLEITYNKMVNMLLVFSEWEMRYFDNYKFKTKFNAVKQLNSVRSLCLLKPRIKFLEKF